MVAEAGALHEPLLPREPEGWPLPELEALAAVLSAV